VDLDVGVLGQEVVDRVGLVGADVVANDMDGFAIGRSSTRASSLAGSRVGARPGWRANRPPRRDSTKRPPHVEMNLESQPSSPLIADQDRPSSSIRIKRARRTEAAAADWLRRRAINSLRSPAVNFMCSMHL